MMNINRDVKGMYCSKRFADWMIKKNMQDTDYPATSYYKLIRLFCRPNYNEFLAEEERKGNEFFYNMSVEGDRIMFKSSYDVVFLPYEGMVSDYPQEYIEADKPMNVDKMLLGYRILQTRSCMPGSPEKAFGYENYYDMKYVIDEILLRSEKIEDFAKSKDISIDHILEVGEEIGVSTVGGTGLGFNHVSGRIKLDDVYRAREFQEAEERSFIDNEFPYSAGTECPDKIICRQMYTRILNHLMREVDRLGLVRGKKTKGYELKVASYVAAILSLSKERSFSITEGLNKADVDRKAKQSYKAYIVSATDDITEICHKIRIGLLWDVNVVIDRTTRAYNDCDISDLEEAPIGLTSEDYNMFREAEYDYDVDFDEELDEYEEIEYIEGIDEDVEEDIP